MRVLVVGAGAMGRWFAQCLIENGTQEVEIAFTDTSHATASAAAAAVGGRAIDPDVEKQFDAVCVAVPIPDAVAAIEAHAQRATDALFDVTGSMAEPIAAMRDHGPKLARVSFHPLFAPENAPGNVAVVRDTTCELAEDVLTAMDRGDNNLFETTVEEHDGAMETIQARAHAAVLSFALAADTVPEPFRTPVSDALFDLMAEVTGGNHRVYADIQETFDGADDVAAAAEAIADADRDTFQHLYEEATANATAVRDGTTETDQ